MLKKIYLSLIPVSLILSSGVAAAQSRHYDAGRGASTQELREELARERYLTEIAMERHKRQKLDREQELRDYDNRIRDVQYRRAEQERINRERYDGINSVNQGVNVIGNILRTIQISSQIR